MFFVKIEGSKFDLLSKLATRSGVDVELLARLALLKGLRLLEIGDANTTHTSVSSGEPLARQRQEQLNALIINHWETKSDWDIGRLMTPNISGINVRYQRLELGLKKTKERIRNRGIKDTIDREEFERMVTHDGYTMTEYLELKNLSFTRQRLEQIANELGVKHSPKDRAPNWIFMRKARKLGNLNLSDSKWLAEQLSKAPSLQSLAAKLGIDEYNLHFFIRRYNLTHPNIRKYGVMTVDLTCAECGTEFKRLKRWVDKRLKRSKEENPKFFCSTSCSGKHNKARFEQRRLEGVVLKKRGKSAKTDSKNIFIRENYLGMSDQEMAEELGLALRTIQSKCRALRLKRSRT